MSSIDFTPSASEVKAVLARILASRGFAASERLSRLLRFTVEQTLAGSGHGLKEYQLGVALFDRREDFDPRIDPIVRVEVSRLRVRLKEYYEGEGRGDPIFIEYPKRSYAPVFRQSTPPVAEEVPEPAAPLDPALAVRRRPIRLRVWSIGGLAALAAVALLIWSLRRPPAPGVESASIAVLPFADLSPDHDQEYLSDGLTEEIINALSKVPGLRVVARTSTFAFKGRPADVREIGTRLNVATLMEGSLRKEGDRLRITAQLINVSNGYHLWSETYEVQMKSVFRLQDDISRAITNALRDRLGAGAAVPATGRLPANANAYQLYLKGRYYWNRRTEQGFVKALELFQQSIAADSGYARAWAGAADAWAALGVYSARPPNEVMPSARVAVQKALALDDTLAEAHASLGYIRATYEWDWVGAESEFRRAIELNPNYATAHQWYAVSVLYPQRRMAEAAGQIRLAHQTDPLSLIVNTAVGLTSMLSRDYGGAVDEFRRVLKMDPGFYMGERSLGIALLLRGDLAEAISALDRAHELSGGNPIVLGELGRAYGQAKRTADARRVLDQLLALREQRYVSPEALAQCYIGLGDRDAAFEWLNRAMDEHAGSVASIAVDPLYDPLRTDARFAGLLTRIHLVP